MNNPPDDKPNQSSHAGRDSTQVGRDYTTTKTTNFNFVFFIIGILALGGLTWYLWVGPTLNPKIQPQPQTSSSPTTKP